jgi:hypothetical protein
MTAGQAAALPKPGWRPAARVDGHTVLFVSEDGTQRQRFDLSSLPVSDAVKRELAAAFVAATGPSGTWKRLGTARNFPAAAKAISTWIAGAHPELETLADLGRADARMLARSFTSSRLLSLAGSLLRYCPTARDEFIDEFSRHRVRRDDKPYQPYEPGQVARISVVARAIVRRARDRIWAHRDLVAEYRAGGLAHLDADNGRRCLAEALDHCARTSDFPRADTGGPSPVARRAVREAGGSSLMRLLHLTPKEVWAFAVLLAAQTGLNRSVLETLPAPHLRASSWDEVGIALVDTYKPRRGSRARTTLPLSAYPPELHPAGANSPLPDSSLNAPYSVYSLLVDLTEPGRRVLGTDLAFVYTLSGTTPAERFATGFPYSDQRQREWVAPWLDADDPTDNVLLNISFQRLRKTRIQQERRPIAQSPSTHVRYLSQMRAVVQDGFAVVRAALDDEVRKALERRELRVILDPATEEDAGPDNDTVLANCSDFTHSPLDKGQACRRTFLFCLDCRNARAFPRHLPFQILVTETLAALRAAMTAQAWTEHHAGRLAQLESVLSNYSPAQQEQARAQITPQQRAIVARLFNGDLDPA